MDAERARKFLLSLPHVAETRQWGDNLVFWVGDKAIGGKMFCLLNLDADSQGVASFSAGPERYAELVERDGLVPAPYMARIFWVAADRWEALRNAEWEETFFAAHALTFAKLPQRIKGFLSLPPRELAMLVAERRKLAACGKPKAKGKPVKNVQSKKVQSKKVQSKA